MTFAKLATESAGFVTYQLSHRSKPHHLGTWEIYIGKPVSFIPWTLIRHLPHA